MSESVPCRYAARAVRSTFCAGRWFHLRPCHDYKGMSKHPTPSAVRVFGKSLRLIAVGWMVCIVGLVAEQIRLAQRRDVDANVGVDMFLMLVVPALVLEWGYAIVAKFGGAAPDPLHNRREWIHACWWALFPVVLLLFTLYLMVSPPV